MKVKLLKKARKKFNIEYKLSQRNGWYYYHFSAFNFEVLRSKSKERMDQFKRNVTLNIAEDIFGYRAKKDFKI